MSVAPHPAAPSLPDRLAVIFAGLRRDLAHHAGRDRALVPLVLLLWSRLSRILARVTAASRAAGRPPRLAAQRRRNGPATAPPRDKLPRQFGWLIRRVPDCVVHGEHLRLLLDDPEVQLLLISAPPLRRLLRPLWRMLRQEAVPDILRAVPAKCLQARSSARSSGSRASTYWVALPAPKRQGARPGTRPPVRLSPKLA